ncbi:KRI1-like protein [Lamellibrachia satsuma]|nr:KRI1-like protein [Lamellibrachia satsuma]
MAEEFRINKDYAERYNKWRKKEELQRLKDKYGDVGDDEFTSSDSEEEDDDAEALTPQLEKDWLETLAAIKRKDPRIYDQSIQFYHSSDKASDDVEKKEKKTKKKVKPMFLKDYERKVLLERDGKLSEDESEDDDRKWQETQKSAYDKEQEELRESLMDAANKDEDDSSDSELFVPRRRTQQEQKQEEDEFEEWTKNQPKSKKKGKKVGTELDPEATYWDKMELTEDDKFLKNYLVNKQYLEEDEDRVPTYYEVVCEDFSEDEETLEKQETFERKYNFRFEEPDPEFIKSYPRTLAESVRRKDTRRAEKRQEVKERKKMEKEKKQEELKQLKNLKKQEILSKLDQLKELTGNTTIGFTDNDIEGDFDPKEHDRMMQKVFNENYYDDDDADTKPVFPEDEELQVEDWDTWEGPSQEDRGMEDGPYCEDEDFNMDADYHPSQDQGMLGLKATKKKKNKFAQALARNKPTFDPDDKTFEEYFDEYYKLDYEDIIGDLPCRFKYRQVLANDFGLSTDEILEARDRELNAWVSIKKMSQYQTEEDEMLDYRIYQKKGRNPKKKMNVLTSLQQKAEQMQVPAISFANDSSNQPRKKKKKKPNQAEDFTTVAPPAVSRTVTGSTAKPQKRTHEELASPKSKKPKTSISGEEMTNRHKEMQLSETVKTGRKNNSRSQTKKKKKHKKKKPKSVGPVMSDERLKAFGINPKKYKYEYLKSLHEKNASKNGS